jgi:hypothetical protein
MINSGYVFPLLIIGLMVLAIASGVAWDVQRAAE